MWLKLSGYLITRLLWLYSVVGNLHGNHKESTYKTTQMEMSKETILLQKNQRNKKGGDWVNEGQKLL